MTDLEEFRAFFTRMGVPYELVTEDNEVLLELGDETVWLHFSREGAYLGLLDSRVRGWYPREAGES